MRLAQTLLAAAILLFTAQAAMADEPKGDSKGAPPKAEREGKSGKADTAKKAKGDWFDAVFRRIDKNGDDSISKDELKEAMKKWHQARSKHHGYHDRKDCDRRHARHHDHRDRHSKYRDGGKCDSGSKDCAVKDRKSGSKDRAAQDRKEGRGAKVSGERRPGWQRSPEEAKKAFEGRFKAADKNADGKLSREEAAGPLKDRFDKIDANQDGQLTQEEITKAMQEWRKAVESRRAKPESKEQ